MLRIGLVMRSAMTWLNTRPSRKMPPLPCSGAEGALVGRPVPGKRTRRGTGSKRGDNFVRRPPDHQISIAVVYQNVDQVPVGNRSIVRYEGRENFFVNLVGVLGDNIINRECRQVPGHVQRPAFYLGVEGGPPFPEKERSDEHGDKKKSDRHEERHPTCHASPPPENRAQAGQEGGKVALRPCPRPNRIAHLII